MENRTAVTVEVLLEETHAAYKSYFDYGCMNADYADYAAMSLSQFKDALQRPDLTREDLARWLRTGMKTHKEGKQALSPWTTFVAHYMEQASNHNAV